MVLISCHVWPRPELRLLLKGCSLANDSLLDKSYVVIDAFLLGLVECDSRGPPR